MARKTRLQYSSIIDESHIHNILFDEREIFLHSDYAGDNDNGIDYKVANTFVKNLRLLERHKYEPIIIHLNTIGGDWSSGISIYDYISLSACPIIVICHGECSSIGTIILQAADIRVIMPNCDFLIHAGHSGMSNLSHKSAQQWAKFELNCFNKMLDIYSTAIWRNSKEFKNKEYAYVKRWLKSQLDKKEEWFLQPEDVIKYGLADFIFGDKSGKAKDVSTLINYAINNV